MIKKIISFSVGAAALLQASTYQLESGWNLLGAVDENLSPSVFSSSNLLWYWEDGVWYASSPNGTYNQALSDASIPPLQSVPNGKGFWVTSTSSGSVDSSKTAFISETQIDSFEFNSTLDGWFVSYSGACKLEHNASIGQENNGSLSVSGRSHNYDGPFLSVTTLLEPNKLYVMRGYLRHNTDVNDTYNLMAKVGTSTYKQLNRVFVDGSDWHLFRAFVSFTQEELDAGVSIYLNSDTYKHELFLDDVEIAKTSFVPPVAPSTKILKISQNRITDEANQTIRLKGINVIAYSDDQSESAEKFRNYTYFNYDKDDFKTIASLGFNSIRVSLWYKYFEEDTSAYVYKDAGFAWLDTIIGWAKEAGIYVVLDMHAPQGGGFQGPSNVTSFWSGTEYKDRFKALWRAIATRYANEPTIAAYDILNEPCPPKESDYISLLNETITSIREVDQKHIINAETSFATDSTLFTLNDSNVLYDFHFYDPWDAYTDNESSIYGKNEINSTMLREDFEAFSNYYTQNNLPFQVSEFGQKYSTFEDKNASAWVKDTLNLLDEKGASYHYFSFKGNEFGLYENKNAFAKNSPKNEDLEDIFMH